MYREVGGYLINDKAFRSPPYNFLFTGSSNSYLPFSADNRRKVRFGLGSASLGEGFSVFGDSAANAMLFPY